MSGWDLFKKSYSSFLCNIENSSMISYSNVLCLKSGVKNESYNFFIVDSVNSDSDKKTFTDNFNCNGFVASLIKNHDAISEWSPSLTFLGKSLIMTADPENIIDIETDPSIIVRFADTQPIVNDHISIIEEVRQTREYGKLVHNSSAPMHIYVAYIDGQPAGTGSAIEVDNKIFILDTITKPRYQNSGVLSSIGNFSMQDAKKKGIESFSTMVTSEYSQKVAQHVGFKIDEIFDFWKNKVN